MFHKDFLPHRRATRCLALLCVLSSLSQFSAAASAQTTPAPTPEATLTAAPGKMLKEAPIEIKAFPIRFAAEVPPVPERMQVYRLEPTKAPLDFFNEKLQRAKVGALKPERDGFIARNGANLTRAFVDPKTGDAHFLPDFSELARMPVVNLPVERAQSLGRAAFADTRFIPKDATELRLADPVMVSGGAATHTPTAGAMRTAPHVVLTMLPAVRYVANFPVYGLGSHALVSIANDGSIVGLVRRWRTASPAQSIKPVVTAAQARADIERQLRGRIKPGTQITVDKIAIAYYDGNANYLQPVYYFEALVHSPDRRVSDVKTAGYVPIGKPLEPIPDLAAPPSGPLPTQPKLSEIAPTSGAASIKRAGGIGGPAGVTLGEYANRDTSDSGYVDMSNTFLSGLTFLHSVFPWWSMPTVTRTQWYYAWPSEVVGASSKSYMNAVNIAYTVPHGNWLYNTTLTNNGSATPPPGGNGWYVPNIGTGGNPGFGAAAGGSLATWIIMSCEVLPSYYDRQNEVGSSHNGYTAFNAWWPVFQGLHNAIGFRTVMFYPDDNLQWSFGYAASLGGDVNAAWFQEVAADYAGTGTYLDTHLNQTVHYGRASTFIDARDLGQSIYGVGAQSASSSLWNFWMNN